MMKRTILSMLLAATMAGLTAQTTFRYKGEELKTDTHTWLVNPHAKDGETENGTVFRSVKEAMLAVDSIQLTVMEEVFTEERPLSIYITPWVYWMDDPDDPTVRRPMKGDGMPYGLKVEMSHTRLIGLSENAEHTILACNRGQTQGAVGNFTMLHLTGENISFENLTLGNYCNVDLEYAPNPSLNRRKRATAIVQAQLAICDGDRVAAHNCRFISRLNTCPLVGAKRTYFEECYFECTDDALCGTGVHFRCRFKLFSGKPFYSTQGTGAIFLDCDLHAMTRGTQYLVKAGSPVTMIDCRWTSEQPNLVINWTQDPTDDLRSYQYNLTLNGEELQIDRRRPHLTVNLFGKQALEAFRLKLPKNLFQSSASGDTLIYNLRNLLQGSDGWNPAKQPDALSAYAKKPIGMAINHRRNHLETGKEPLTLKAVSLCFAERADFSKPTKGIEWHVEGRNPECVEIEEQEDGTLTVTGNNHGEDVETVNVIATDPNGLETACIVTVHPRQLPPPEFIAAPTMTRENDTLKVDYTLDLQGRYDHSTITWLRCLGANGEGAIPVAVSRLDTPLKAYRLTASDNGYYIRATIAPKSPRSTFGRIMSLTTNAPVSVTAEEPKRMETDFVSFPTKQQTAIHPGFWTMDAYKPIDTQGHDWEPDMLKAPWYYGQGMDGAAGIYGLIQGTRGARLLYTPLSHTYGDMSLTLEVDPCKTAGQGFGSATGQYMDIYIKMDTRTLTGYALRIERTNKHDKAVDFRLMKYEQGKAIPITAPVSAICFRTGCQIRIDATGNTLTAKVTNNKDLPEIHQEGLVKEVNLTATITPNVYGGIGILHTGSTGASATVLRTLAVEWK